MSIHDDGFIFNDPRYLADMSAADRRELRLFVGGPLADELPESENEMATKTTAKTTAKTTTRKETTVKTTTKTAPTKLTGKEKRAAELAALKEKYDAPAFTDPVNAHNILKALYESEQTGTEVTPKGLYAAPDELEYLCWVAREYGWTNNAFVSKSQVPALHGVVKEGAHSVKLFPVKGFPGTYYNYDDIEWENGEPTYDPEVGKQQSIERRAAKAKRRENVQILGLPNGTTMEININDKKAMANYLATCAAIEAAMKAMGKTA